MRMGVESQHSPSHDVTSYESPIRPENKRREGEIEMVFQVNDENGSGKPT